MPVRGKDVGAASGRDVLDNRYNDLNDDTVLYRPSQLRSAKPNEGMSACRKNTSRNRHVCLTTATSEPNDLNEQIH